MRMRSLECMFARCVNIISIVKSSLITEVVYVVSCPFLLKILIYARAVAEFVHLQAFVASINNVIYLRSRCLSALCLVTFHCNAFSHKV